jgi:hypothetical protein
VSAGSIRIEQGYEWPQLLTCLPGEEHSKSMPVNPDEVFNNAMCFMVAYRHMTKLIQPERDQLTTIASAAPLLMMGGLTTELMLKTFHALHNGTVPRSHDLADLYRNLPMAMRIAIKKKFNSGAVMQRRKALYDMIEGATGERPPDDLPELLSRASTAFETYRYSFEDPPGGNMPDFLLSDFPQVLIDVIIDLKPEWKSWRPRMPPAIERRSSERLRSNVAS